MKKILLIIVYLLMSRVVVAGSLAEKVQSTYQNVTEFQAEFVQKTKIELLDKEVTESGKLFFQKPGFFVIHYEGAKERKYISNGKTLWLYRPADHEVEVYDHLKDILSREALVFLGGLGHLTEEFRVQEKSNTLDLTPKNKKSPFQKLQLTIDQSTGLVKEVFLFPKKGNKSHYDFSKTRTDFVSPKKFFEFSEKNVSVIRP